MLTIVLIVVVVLLLGGGGYWYSNRGPDAPGWHGPGFGLLGLVIVILLVLFLTGNLGHGRF